jgi:hypothetical protein
MLSCAALPGQGRCGSTATHPPCCSCRCCASHGPMRRDGGVVSTHSATAGLIAHGSPLAAWNLFHPHGLNERSRRWLRTDLDPLAGRAKREGDVPAGLLGNPVPRWPLLSALWRTPTQGADGAGAMAHCAWMVSTRTIGSCSACPVSSNGQHIARSCHALFGMYYWRECFRLQWEAPVRQQHTLDSAMATTTKLVQARLAQMGTVLAKRGHPATNRIAFKATAVKGTLHQAPPHRAFRAISGSKDAGSQAAPNETSSARCPSCCR